MYNRKVDRFNYFLLGLINGCYKWKAWTLRAFSKSNLLNLEEGKKKFETRYLGGSFQEDENNYPYELYKFTDSDSIEKYCFIDPVTAEVVSLNISTDEVLLDINEEIFVPSGIIDNIDSPTVTTTGRLLFNQYCLVYAFGNIIPFQNKNLKYGDIEKFISKLMLDEPENEQDRKPGKIYPFMMDKYYKGTGMTTGLNAICVPSATRFTLTPAPEALKLAKKLFKKHKDELNDPIVAANIWKQIREEDVKYVQSDPEFGFLISDKHFDVVRKKLYYCYGEEWSLDGSEMTFITKPLSEGIDLDNYAAVNNGTREGSFSRGALTALAGERTKNSVRATTGSTIVEEDCGTKLTLRLLITNDNKHQQISKTIIEGNQKVLLTEENIDKYIGKKVNLRSTAYCNSDENDFCLTCFSHEMKGRETTISAEKSTVPLDFMGRFMSAMHGKIYKTVKYPFRQGFGID